MATNSSKKRHNSKPASDPMDRDLPAAYFLSLTIKNVRCFGPIEQTFDLSDRKGRPAQWTVLLGNNGTGKTTLLECLIAFNVRRAHTPPERDVIDGIYWIQTSRDHHLNCVGSDEDAELTAETISNTLISDPPDRLSKSARDRLVIGRYRAEHHGHQDRSLPLCFGYGAARRMGSASLAEDIDGDAVVTIFDDQWELRNAEELFLRLDYSAAKESTIRETRKQRLEQVKRVLLSILPDVSDIRISELTKQRPIPRVEFKTPDGWVPLRWIGYGYRTLVAWMVDFASRMLDRYPDSLDPLAEPAVVLVDEIDLHLHPKWQRSLMGYLTERFPNTQFIVTAHSPLFVQAAAGANLVVLRRDEEKGYVVIDNDVEAIKNWRIDQVLTSDLFGLPTARPPQLESMLEERTKLLSKSKLTKKDQKRLEALESEIGPLPAGETARDAKTRLLLEKTLRTLEEREQAGR